MHKAQHDYEVIFVDVGQGDGTLIRQLSNMHSVLIDAGAGKPVLSVLKQSSKLEAIFITHWDKDHIGGMPGVISWLSNQHQKTVNVFINLQDTSTDIAKKFRRTLEEAYNNGTIELKPACNDSKGSIEIIDGKFLILWPPHATVVLHPENRNLGSLVLRFKVGVFSLLLGGDATGDVWPCIDHMSLKTDIFRYPHHGGALFNGTNSWSADQLISKVNPDWIVVSVGANNPHGHPSKEFIDAQSRHPNIQFLYTIKGNINLKIESSTANIIRMRK